MKIRRKPLKLVILSLIAALLIFAPAMSVPQTAEAAASAETTQYVNNYTEARKVLDLVNAKRTAQKLTKLKLDAKLESIAMLRAKELVTKFSNIRPNGKSGLTLIIGNYYKGENIAKGQTTADAVVNAWYSNTGHRTNILKDKYVSTGIGCVKYKNVNYWVQVFSSNKNITPVNIPVTKVTLTPTTITLVKGKSVKLKATVSPSNATNKNITWISNNAKVATIDKNGTVKGVKKGQAKITVKTSNGKTATCTVKVV